MLVNADTGRVDHDDVTIVGRRNGFEKPIPYPRFPPAHEAVVAGGRRAIALRDFRPGRARSKPPKDAIQHPSIIDPRNTAGLVGQQRRYDRPFVVGQFVATTRHQMLPYLETLNHPGL